MSETHPLPSSLTPCSETTRPPWGSPSCCAAGSSSGCTPRCLDSNHFSFFPDIISLALSLSFMRAMGQQGATISLCLCVRARYMRPLTSPSGWAGRKRKMFKVGANHVQMQRATGSRRATNCATMQTVLRIIGWQLVS